MRETLPIHCIDKSYRRIICLMQKYLLFLGSLSLLLPTGAFAAGKADLVNSIADIYANTGEEFSAIARNESLSPLRKFQTLSNASKAKHDAAMAAIQNTR